MDPPTSTAVPFGVRITLFFLIRALSEYARHEVNVSATVPSGVKTALDTLLAALPELIALNPPGPN